MSDNDLIKLYSKQILALASTIPHLGELDAPQGSAKVRSPLCGSTVSTGVKLDNGAISEFAQSVKACALGQASASLLGKVALSQSPETVQRGRDELAAMLKEGGPVPAAPFDGFEVLQPAQDFKNRHASILLPFDALLGAIEDARGD